MDQKRYSIGKNKLVDDNTVNNFVVFIVIVIVIVIVVVIVTVVSVSIFVVSIGAKNGLVLPVLF